MMDSDRSRRLEELERGGEQLSEQVQRSLEGLQLVQREVGELREQVARLEASLDRNASQL